MAKSEKISIREYARRLNIDEKAVRKARDANLLGNGWDAALQKIDFEKANKNWGYQHKVIKPRPGVSRVKALEKMEKQPSEKLGKKTSPQGEDKGKVKQVKPKQTVDKPPETVPSEDEILDSEDKLESIVITRNTQTPEAMRLREVFGAAMDKMKLLELQGSLVKKADVEKSLYSYATEIKKELLNLPKRVIENIRAAPTSVDATNIFLLELNSVLEKLSNPSPLAP